MEDKAEKKLPQPVLEAFKELIALRSIRGMAWVPRADVVDLLVTKGFSVDEIEANGWLIDDDEFLDAFLAEGWGADFDEERGIFYFEIQPSVLSDKLYELSQRLSRAKEKRNRDVGLEQHSIERDQALIDQAQARISESRIRISAAELEFGKVANEVARELEEMKNV